MTPPEALRTTRRCALARAIGRGVFALCGLLSLPPISADAAEPESTYVRTHYEKQITSIPMRDGTRLFTIVFSPREVRRGLKYPIVLIRTPFSIAPYDSATMPATIAPDPIMLRDGYIFVQQEVRGRYRSEGTFENVRPLAAPAPHARTARAVRTVDEATDAWDTIDWLLRHVGGHNGRVGLLGVSYGGYYAGLAAATRHPALRALSLQAPVADFWFEDFRHNGALQLGNIFAFPVFGTPRPAPTSSHWWLPAFQRAAAADTGQDYATLLALGPLRTITNEWYAADSWWNAHREHPDYDAFWRARSLLPALRDVRVPTLVVGGWFDAENLWGALASHRALQASAKAPVTLVMGPFAHRAWSARDSAPIRHGALLFNDAPAARFQRDMEAPFFRATLKTGSAAVSPPAGAYLYDTGRARWVHHTSWPARGVTERWWFGDDDSLRPMASERTATREFVSDPARPVPSRCTGPTIEDGGVRNYLTDDQRCLRGRDDVLTFVGPVLTADVTVAGPLQADVVIATTATDLDVVVKLVDVFPDSTGSGKSPASGNGGREQLVRGEIVRARHRAGATRSAPMRPGVAERVTVTLPDVYHTFRAGHRIMVQLHSSWFPLFDRNPQRFVPNIFEAAPGDFITARHTVWVGGARGSRLTATVLRDR